MVDHGQATFWTGLLEEFFSDVEALGTAGYRRLSTETPKWKQARDQSSDDLDHLELQVTMGGISRVDGSHNVHACTARYVFRRLPDDDSKSQAQAYASMHDLWWLLLRWHHGTTCRTRPTSSDVQANPDSYLITIQFDLYIPWRD